MGIPLHLMITLIAVLFVILSFSRVFCVELNEVESSAPGISTACINSSVAVVDGTRHDEIDCDNLDAVLTKFLTGGCYAGNSNFELQGKDEIICQDENGNYFVIKRMGNGREVVALIDVGNDSRDYSEFYLLIYAREKDLNDLVEIVQQKAKWQIAGEMGNCELVIQPEDFERALGKNELSDHELIAESYIIDLGDGFNSMEQECVSSKVCCLFFVLFCIALIG
ncbi:hypothetical protein THOM_0297 [Trachipleistophora hominis]|uniref:Uncharacterized protein n=1 Tax=Trachipleistophora hominis TaxID=72359 RepID=L7K0B7_TRAHO|nr:hypothetical protein THOM_0297 [Trachipleistophora hominis]